MGFPGQRVPQADKIAAPCFFGNDNQDIPGTKRKKEVIMKRALCLTVLAVFVIAITGVAFACGGSTQPSGTSTTSMSQTITSTSTSTEPVVPNEISITDDGFVPQTLTIPAGTKVTWYNKSNKRRWVTSQTKVPDTQVIAIGARAGYTFKDPGTYNYYDYYNKDLTGTIIVQ
jgi:plastocyanin